MSWTSEAPPPDHKIGFRGALRVLWRGVPMALLVFGGLALLLALRPLEAMRHKTHRPWTPFITRTVCRGALRIMGLQRKTVGSAMREGGALVCNHVSWLDIFALNAGGCIVFVSKAEVAGWPGIGWLARATGTLFVTRNRAAAPRDIAALQTRLALGETLVFFPEGTSSDGRQVLPFKPTLFAPLIAMGLQVQPVTLSYHAPAGADPRAYGWWGEMLFGTHLLSTLAMAPQGSVTVTYHPARRLTPQTDRKALASDIRASVASAL